MLVALLFLADWYLPKPEILPNRSDADKSVIRISSAQKWPEPIAIDTSLPTIVPFFPDR
jgi:hypothetical protein